MGLLGVVGRPGVSWGALGCLGVSWGNKTDRRRTVDVHNERYNSALPV